MGITVRWDNADKPIVVYEFQHPWTWQNFFDAIESEHAMLETIDHHVDVLFYASSERIMIPPNALSNLKRLINMSHPQEDRFYIVGAPMLLRSLMDTLQRVYGMRGYLDRYSFVDTLDNAYTELEKRKAAGG